MRNITNSVFFWLGAIMVLVSLSLAGAMLLTDFYLERMSGTKRTLFIVTLLAYAAYRSYRMYSEYKLRKHEVED